MRVLTQYAHTHTRTHTHTYSHTMTHNCTLNYTLIHKPTPTHIHNHCLTCLHTHMCLNASLPSFPCSAAYDSRQPPPRSSLQPDKHQPSYPPSAFAPAPALTSSRGYPPLSSTSAPAIHPRDLAAGYPPASRRAADNGAGGGGSVGGGDRYDDRPRSLSRGRPPPLSSTRTGSPPAKRSRLERDNPHLSDYRAPPPRGGRGGGVSAGGGGGNGGPEAHGSRSAAAAAAAAAAGGSGSGRAYGSSRGSEMEGRGHRDDVGRGSGSWARSPPRARAVSAKEAAAAGPGGFGGSATAAPTFGSRHNLAPAGSYSVPLPRGMVHPSSHMRGGGGGPSRARAGGVDYGTVVDKEAKVGVEVGGFGLCPAPPGQSRPVRGWLCSRSLTCFVNLSMFVSLPEPGHSTFSCSWLVCSCLLLSTFSSSCLCSDFCLPLYGLHTCARGA